MNNRSVSKSRSSLLAYESEMKTEKLHIRQITKETGEKQIEKYKRNFRGERQK